MIDYSKFGSRAKPGSDGDASLRFNPLNNNINLLKSAVTTDLMTIHDLVNQDQVSEAISNLMEINIKFNDISGSLKLSKEFMVAQDGIYRLNEISKLINSCREDIKSLTMFKMNEANNAM